MANVLFFTHFKAETYPSPSEDKDLLAFVEQSDDVIKCIDIFPLLSLRWLRDVDDDLPQCHIIQIRRENSIRKQISKDCPWVGLHHDVLLDETVGACCKHDKEIRYSATALSLYVATVSEAFVFPLR